MYDAKRWQMGVPSFRLEPLFRRRVPKLHSILEHVWASFLLMIGDSLEQLQKASVLLHHFAGWLGLPPLIGKSYAFNFFLFPYWVRKFLFLLPYVSDLFKMNLSLYYIRKKFEDCHARDWCWRFGWISMCCCYSCTWSAL